MVQIIGLGVSIVLMLILNIVIKKTKIGKAIRAVSMSTETAALLGINPTMIISVTVMIASALGAAAGVLVGLSFNAIEPTMGVIIGFKGLAVLILGGLGNIYRCHGWWLYSWCSRGILCCLWCFYIP